VEIILIYFKCDVKPTFTYRNRKMVEKVVFLYLTFSLIASKNLSKALSTTALIQFHMPVII
jgi:hypothetical protein